MWSCQPNLPGQWPRKQLAWVSCRLLLGELPASFPPMNLSFYYVTSTLQLSSVAAVGIYSTEIGQHCKSFDEPRELVVNHPQHAISLLSRSDGSDPRSSKSWVISESEVPRTS